MTERELMLERELSQLGPLMRQAERVRSAGPDSAWVAAVRVRLVNPDPAAPRPVFQRRLRKRLVGAESRFPLPAVLAAAALIAVAVLVALALHPFGANPHHSGTVAGFPRPAKRDLVRGYPYLGLNGAGGGGGGPSLTVSLTDGPAGEAYPARLRLREDTFAPFRSRMAVYELSAHPLQGPALLRVAHLLGIRARQTCVSPWNDSQRDCNGGAWRVVAHFPGAHRFELHSLAVSPLGEVVYHDLSYNPSVFHRLRLSPREAAGVARSWLERLGWPAARMPVLSAVPTAFERSRRGRPIELKFGWAKGIDAVLPAATLWVTSAGRVIEAHLWPPVNRRQYVAARSLHSAWTDVARGTTPIAVEVRDLSRPIPGGAGRASMVTVAEALVTPNHEHAYLEPVYRFSGVVHLNDGVGTHAWYALVPAASR
ncbi:MAG TPA: hypothetical protein VG815_17345 [Chloroflexota bacterium]|nr:hypothetical protein [Chloroflexota bacterium]